MNVHTNCSDQEIIKGLQSSGSSFEKYSIVLFRMCHNYQFEARKKHPLLDETAITEAYIDSVDAIIKKVMKGQYDQKLGKLSTLLYQIFSNKCIDQLRRYTNNKSEWRRRLDEITVDLPVQSRDFLHDMIEQDEFDKMIGTMDKLGENCKQLIMDFDYWGFKPDEVAQRRGYGSGKSASQAKYKCMENLRKLIREKQLC